MDLFNSILYPVLGISGLGLIFGIALGFAGKLLQTENDIKVTQIRGALPGTNCTGCGFAGCDAFAEAVACGRAPVSGCPIGGSACADKLADIMGIEHQSL